MVSVRSLFKQEVYLKYALYQVKPIEYQKGSFQNHQTKYHPNASIRLFEMTIEIPQRTARTKF